MRSVQPPWLRSSADVQTAVGQPRWSASSERPPPNRRSSQHSGEATNACHHHDNHRSDAGCGRARSPGVSSKENASGLRVVGATSPSDQFSPVTMPGRSSSRNDLASGCPVETIIGAVPVPPPLRVAMTPFSQVGDASSRDFRPIFPRPADDVLRRAPRSRTFVPTPGTQHAPR